MPVTPSYPGIYIEELPSTVHTIAAAPTSIAVFVGYTHPWKTQHPNKAVELFSFTDYQREFGGFYNGNGLDNAVPHAVNQFFLNGGAQAYVVGFTPPTYPRGAGSLAGVTFTALEPTDPKHPIIVSFEKVGSSKADVTVTYGNRPPETYRGVSLVSSDSDYIVKRMNGLSSYVRVTAGNLASFTAKAPSVAPRMIPAVTEGDITFTAKNLNQIEEITIVIKAAVSGASDVTITVGAESTPYPAVTIADIATKLQSSPYVSVAAGANAALPSTDKTLKLTPSIVLDGVKFTPKSAAAVVNVGISASGKTADVTITSGTASVPYSNVSVNEFLDAEGTTPNPDFIITRMVGSQLVKVAIVDDWPQTKSVKLDQGAAENAAKFFDGQQFTKVFDTDSDLDKLPIFNILVLPGVAEASTLTTAITFAERKRAFMILDPRPNDVAGQNPTSSEKSIETYIDDVAPKSVNGAVYFPYLKSTDPLTGQPKDIAPSGFVAGIFARTDNNRGVWKAPAGLETTILGTTGVVEDGRMNDMRQGKLNLAGINCLRTFPGIGTVVFGARTLVSANPSYEQWRYVPVRRMALFIEQTLYRNLGWAVFEPNDEPLWVALRTSVENFMLSLFSRGAFQGSKPSQAFSVQCDHSTTTQTDINNGIVNIIVAFAPLKPAEFVIVKIAQLAGQTH